MRCLVCRVGLGLDTAGQNILWLDTWLGTPRYLLTAKTTPRSFIVLLSLSICLLLAFKNNFNAGGFIFQMRLLISHLTRKVNELPLTKAENNKREYLKTMYKKTPNVEILSVYDAHMHEYHCNFTFTCLGQLCAAKVHPLVFVSVTARPRLCVTTLWKGSLCYKSICRTIIFLFNQKQLAIAFTKPPFTESAIFLFKTKTHWNHCGASFACSIIKWASSTFSVI